MLHSGTRKLESCFPRMKIKLYMDILIYLNKHKLHGKLCGKSDNMLGECFFSEN